MKMTSNAEWLAALRGHLTILYGSAQAAEQLPRFLDMLEPYQASPLERPPSAGPLTQRDAVLITYADQVQRPGEPPLRSLHAFLRAHLKGLLSGVHILPFYPYSSDDGFSVIDYREVMPTHGDWADVRAIAADFRLMVDAVVNHASAQSEWFQAYLRDDPQYRDYFVAVDPAADLSAVVRPRDLPLLTPFETQSGARHIWTTFSADQVDLNFGNPNVLAEIVDLLLYYVGQGAQIIRLDAIAFVWKEIGSSSIHLPQTHEVVKLMRTVIEAVAPWVLLITETNVPHQENLSYFGDGSDEAHLVYQFALPPLVLHTLCAGDASRLTAWAADLELPGDEVSFFNFTASHDGVGLRPVSEILSESELETLLQQTEARGGGVSYRSMPGGGRTPYELNVTYLDAMTDPHEFQQAPDRAAARFLASQAIMLAVQGLPAIYFHSLVGSRNDQAGRQRTGRLRSINREKLQLEGLERQLNQSGTLRQRIFHGYRKLLQSRGAHPAFSPTASQEVLDLGPGLFALVRQDPEQSRRMLCLHEVSGQDQQVSTGSWENTGEACVDLLGREAVDLARVRLSPYQVRWIDLDGTADT